MDEHTDPLEAARDALEFRLEWLGDYGEREYGADLEQVTKRYSDALAALSSPRPWAIEFDGAAGETFQKVIRDLSGYTVQVTPDEGEPFDAELLGPDTDADYYDAVHVRRADDDGEVDDDAEIESVRAQVIRVY